MKKLTALLPLLICMLFINSINAQEEDNQGWSEEDMAQYMEMVKPDENHEWLAKFNGTYKYEMMMWAPGMDVDVSYGIAKRSMQLGDRYQVMEVEGDSEEMPFTGIGMTGYDKVKQMYVSTWADNWGTGIMIYKGTREGNTLELTTTYLNPMTQGMEVHRMLITYVDDKTDTMTLYITPDGGEEYKAIHITYSKKS